MSGEYQLIPARHGTATFVPRDHTIMIRNTYGKQVVDTWAFALNTPPKREKGARKLQNPAKKEESNTGKSEADKDEGLSKCEEELYDQVKSESKGAEDQENKNPEQNEKAAVRNSWSSYLPTFRSAAAKKENKGKDEDEEILQRRNSKTWASYLPSGEGFTSYLPSSDALSAFASSHHRDPSKSIAEQLYDFSKTPVGAAGLSGMYLGL